MKCNCKSCFWCVENECEFDLAGAIVDIKINDVFYGISLPFFKEVGEDYKCANWHPRLNKTQLKKLLNNLEIKEGKVCNGG